MAIFAPKAHKDGSSIGLPLREWSNVISTAVYTTSSIIGSKGTDTNEQPIVIDSGSLGLQANGNPIIISPYTATYLFNQNLEEDVVGLRLNNLMEPSANYSMNNFIIKNSAYPTEDQDVASKIYVDNLINGIKWKQSVVCASQDAFAENDPPVKFWRSYHDSTFIFDSYKFYTGGTDPDGNLNVSDTHNISYRDTTATNNGLGYPGWQPGVDAEGRQTLTFKIPEPYHENYVPTNGGAGAPNTYPRGAGRTSIHFPGWTNIEYQRARLTSNMARNLDEGSFTWRDKDTFSPVSYQKRNTATQQNDLMGPFPSGKIPGGRTGNQAPQNNPIPTTDFSQVINFNKHLLDNIIGDTENKTILKDGDRILIKEFVTPTTAELADGVIDMTPYNGIWEVVHTGSILTADNTSWRTTEGITDLDVNHVDYYKFPILRRTEDFNDPHEISSAAVFVEEGEQNEDISFVVTTNSSSFGNSAIGTFPVDWTVYGTTYVDRATIYKDLDQNERLEVTGVLRDIHGHFYDEYINNISFEDPEMGAVSYFENTNTGRIRVPDNTFLVGDGTTFVPEAGNTVRTSLGLGTGSLVTFHSLTLQGDNTLNGVAGALTASAIVGQTNYFGGDIKIDSNLSGTVNLDFQSLDIDNYANIGGNVQIDGTTHSDGNISTGGNLTAAQTLIVNGTYSQFGQGNDLISFNNGQVTIGSPYPNVVINDGEITAKKILTEYLTASISLSSSYLTLESTETIETYRNKGYPTNENTLFVIDGGLRWNNLSVAGGSGVGGQERTDVEFLGGNIYSNDPTPPPSAQFVPTYLRIGVSGSNLDDNAYTTGPHIDRQWGYRILEGSFIKLSGSDAQIDSGKLDNVSIGYKDGPKFEGQNLQFLPGTVSKATLTELTGSKFRLGVNSNHPGDHVITGSQAYFDYINAATELKATLVDINGGTIDNTNIGLTTPAQGSFTSLVANTADINGGTIDGADINVTGKTLTVDNGHIKANKISGGSTRGHASGLFEANNFYSYSNSVIDGVSELTGTFAQFDEIKMGEITAGNEVGATEGLLNVGGDFSLIGKPSNRGLLKWVTIEKAEITADATFAETGSFLLLSSSHLIVNDQLEDPAYIEFYLDPIRESKILGSGSLYLDANRIETKYLSGSFVQADFNDESLPDNHGIEFNLIGVNNSKITGSFGKFTHLGAQTFNVDEIITERLTASLADINGGEIDNVWIGGDPNFDVVLTASVVDINSGRIDNAILGRDNKVEITASAGFFDGTRIFEIHPEFKNQITSSFVRLGSRANSGNGVHGVFNDVRIKGNKGEFDIAENHYGSIIDVGYVTASFLSIGDPITNNSGNLTDKFTLQIMGGSHLTASSLGSRGRNPNRHDMHRGLFHTDVVDLRFGHNYLYDIRTPDSGSSNDRFIGLNRNYFDKHTIKRTVRVAIDASGKTDADLYTYRSNNGTQHTNGVILDDGDRILLYNSVNPYVNGIWIVGTNGITRAEDFRAGSSTIKGVPGIGVIVSVSEGTNNSNSLWMSKLTTYAIDNDPATTTPPYTVDRTLGNTEVPYKPASGPYPTNALLDFVKISDPLSVFTPEDGLTFETNTTLLKVDLYEDGVDPFDNEALSARDGFWPNLTFTNSGKLVLSQSLRADKFRADTVKIGGNTAELGSVGNVIGSIDSTRIGQINPQNGTFTMLSASLHLQVGRPEAISEIRPHPLATELNYFGTNATFDNDVDVENTLDVGNLFRVWNGGIGNPPNSLVFSINNNPNGSNISIYDSHLYFDDLGAKPNNKLWAFYNYNGDLYWENTLIARGGTYNNPDGIEDVPDYKSIYITGEPGEITHKAFFSSSLVIQSHNNSTTAIANARTGSITNQGEIFNSNGDLFWYNTSSNEADIIHSGSNIDIDRILFEPKTAPFTHIDNTLVNVTGSLYWKGPSPASEIELGSGGGGGAGNSPFSILHGSNTSATPNTVTLTQGTTYFSLDMGNNTLANQTIQFPPNSTSGDELTVFIYRAGTDSTITLQGGTSGGTQDQIVDYISPANTASPMATTVTDVPTDSFTTYGFIYAATGDPHPFSPSPATLAHGLWLPK